MIVGFDEDLAEDSIGGVQRVVKALKERPIDKDLKIFHVTGRCEQTYKAIEDWGKDYVVIQYCLRSTQKKDTKYWIPMWERAKCVWSYYDLPAWVKEDGHEANFNFYHGPLGIEPIFNYKPRKKSYVVLTHGNYQTQGTKQTVNANPKTMAHLGEPFPTSHSSIDFYTNISDEELVDLYNSTYYVCALRRFEGFELPAAEALACGARPILFDRPHYKQWFQDHAVYIPEESKAEEIEDLKRIFMKRRPVAAKESHWAKTFFNWDIIIKEFYEHL